MCGAPSKTVQFEGGAVRVEKRIEFPSVEQIDGEIRRVRAKRQRRRWRNAVLVLLVAALAAGIFLSMKYVSFLKIGGNSMEATLRSGDIVLYRKNVEIDRGDVVVIDRGDVIMVKRVIGLEGDRVMITAAGKVFVNGTAIEEDYVSEFSLGNSDAEYPVTVPEDCCFVLGDNRSTSLDSRNSGVGMISVNEIRGEILAVLWPAYRIGKVQ